jgi:phosphoribosylanthranilate isomerase
MVRVKICGVTCIQDALAAVRSGADALGFVFADSPRRITPEAARRIARELPPFAARVGVFVNAPISEIRRMASFCTLTAIQLHGDEHDAMIEALALPVIKALRAAPGAPDPTTAYPNAALLLDTYAAGKMGGTGKTFDWRLAVDVAKIRPIILAGGLNPENVADAVRMVRPFAVDVSSGVEIEPGRKDHAKVQRFIREAKAAAWDL